MQHSPPPTRVAESVDGLTYLSPRSTVVLTLCCLVLLIVGVEDELLIAWHGVSGGDVRVSPGAGPSMDGASSALPEVSRSVTLAKTGAQAGVAV